MARQSSTPVQFNRTTRGDMANILTSARAGVVVPIGHAPLLRGDSASGSVQLELKLAEMPRPLLNAVMARVQAWFVPKAAMPQFSGYDEFMHSYQGGDIKQLGAADRTPPAFFGTEATAGDITALNSSELFTTMGLHLVPATTVQTDLIDAFNLIYNFRLAAHSTKLTRRDYYSEDETVSVTLPPAFWPRSRSEAMVPDYEQALILGQLDLDVLAGQLPVTFADVADGTNVGVMVEGKATGASFDPSSSVLKFSEALGDPANKLFAEMAGQAVQITLAEIDRARTTQSFAKMRSAYAGTDHSGFANDDVIIAEMMQGFSVPDELYKRPWLLDNKMVTFGFVERHATDAANLDDSISTAVAQASLSINVPRQETGGVIIYTVEVLPELITERASDEWLYCTTVADLPDALRDVQRIEPVDQVPTRRIDTAHTTPAALYGYEPMNAKWRREFTRLGGEYRQATPGTPVTDQRSAIWQADVVDPVFTSDHWLAPSPFPHDVFSDTLADAFDVVARHNLSISGITQFGDVLVEDNDDFTVVEAEAS